MNHNWSKIMALTLIGMRRTTSITQLSILCVCSVFQGAVSRADDNQWAGTFFESIADVQTQHLNLPDKDYDKPLSIPYTRIDIAMDNGIALARVVQVYHNHSSTNQGYALNMPISAKTAITEFNLWDRGTRYVGSIEDRMRAEDVYREVTGDETPTMNTDPGLVRRTRNRYQTRIFPIFPEENKQVELVSCALSEMKNDKVTFRFDLGALVKATDPRHAKLASRRTDVSIFVRDLAGMEDLKARGVSGDFLPLAEGYVLRSTFDAADRTPTDSITISYTIPSPSGVKAHPFTFTDGSQSFFLLRVLARASDLYPVELPEKPEKPFYIGVWNSDEIVKMTNEQDVFKTLTWEIGAFFALQLMDIRSGYHGSWRPERMEMESPSAKGAASFPRAVVSDQLRMQTDIESVLGDANMLGQVRTEEKKDGTVDVVEHLEKCITGGACDTVILFLKEIELATWERLAAVIVKVPEVNFVLVTSESSLPENVDASPNVAHFSGNEWITIRPFLAERSFSRFKEYDTPPLGILTGVLEEGFGSFPQISSLYRRLPRLLGVPKSYQVGGDAKVEDVYADGLDQFKRAEGGTQRTRDEDKLQENPLHVVWISGSMRHSGEFDLSITDYTTPELTRLSPLVDPNQESGQRLWRLHVNSTLPPPSRRNRFVATMWAQPKAESLAMRLRELRRITEGNGAGRQAVWGEEGDTHEERRRHALEEIAKVRTELVDLSRMYSFICSETAFIALPPDLIEKYGLMPQEFSRDEMFNLGGAASGGVPEPHDYLLFAIGALIAWYVIRRNMCSVKHAKI